MTLVSQGFGRLVLRGLRPRFGFALVLLALDPLCGSSHGSDLAFGRQDAVLGHLGIKRLETLFVFPRSWRCQTQRTPNGEMDRPRWRSSFDTRAWPQVGCSMAISTTAFSISGSSRFFRIGFRRLISWRASSPLVS